MQVLRFIAGMFCLLVGSALIGLWAAVELAIDDESDALLLPGILVFMLGALLVAR